MRFRENREQRTEKNGPDLVGSPAAIGQLFSGGYPMQVRKSTTKEDREKRRKALAGRWSAMMAQVSHPVAALKKAWAESSVATTVSWQAYRRRHRDKPLTVKALPGLAALVTVIAERAGDNKSDRRTAKRIVRRAGHSWQSANRQLRAARRLASISESTP